MLRYQLYLIIFLEHCLPPYCIIQTIQCWSMLLGPPLPRNGILPRASTRDTGTFICASICGILQLPSKKNETFYIKHHKTWTYSTLICSTWCFTQPTPHTYLNPCQGHVGYRRATGGSGLDEVVLMGRAWCTHKSCRMADVFLPISCLSSCCYQNLFRFL